MIRPMKGFLKAQTDRHFPMIYQPYRQTITKTRAWTSFAIPLLEILMVTDMALLALKNEGLGKDEETDVLMISYSSTDHIGHQFGLTAIETQDTYLRLDLELERLFSEIDQMVGMDDVTLFLTSDHGAVHVPKYLNDHKFPGGHDKSNGIKDQVNQVLLSKTGVDNLVLHIGNDQMYLDHEQIDKNKLDLDEWQMKQSV